MVLVLLCVVFCVYKFNKNNKKKEEQEIIEPTPAPTSEPIMVEKSSSLVISEIISSHSHSVDKKDKASEKSISASIKQSELVEGSQNSDVKVSEVKVDIEKDDQNNFEFSNGKKKIK